MPTPDDLPVALARLGMLARQPDVNIRPVLLRLAVDLFLQKPHHAPDDLKLFEAMVGPLIEDADAATRRTLLARLVEHPATPKGLLERLTDDESLITGEVYRHASFTEEELLSVATSGSAMVAMHVAERGDLSQTVVTFLAARQEASVALALARNKTIILGSDALQGLVRRARHDPTLAESLTERGLDPMTLAPLFPLLAPDARRRIIDAVRRMELGRRQWGRPDVATLATLAKLDRLILNGEWDGFDLTLAGAIGCDQLRLRPLLHDGTGDILALALAAAGADADLAARAFILGEPTIGRSVTAVRRLTGLVETIAPQAARRLILAMIDEGVSAAPRRREATAAAPGARRAPEAIEAPAARRDAPETPRRAGGGALT